jgi:serine/threonine protein kinase
MVEDPMPDANGSMDVGAGSVLGKCRLVQRIGQGGMGVVWEARHLTLEIPVAVKILREQGLSPTESARYRERFQREARIAARLSHPGLVRVLDFGEDGGRPFLVMELVQGWTLEQYLSRQQFLPEKLAIQVVGHVCSALSVAHQAGVIHRDIKPSNILVDKEGKLKVSDLGLARDLSAPAMTGPDGILGTPLYVAPEVIDGLEDVDHRADLYSVGVLLYQMLFGKPPFQGGAAQILHAHAFQQPDLEPPPGVAISSATRGLLRKLLEKRPEKRPESAADVVATCRSIHAKLEGRSSRESDGQRVADSADSRFRKALVGQFGASVSVEGGRRILHTTLKERVMVWALLALVVAAAIGGWLASR